MSAEQPRRYTRRQIVVGLAVVGGLIAAGEGARRVFLSEPTREDVENEFGVILLTARDLFAEKGMPYPENERYWGTGLNKRDVPQVWTPEQLGVLRASLKALPEHFYSPSPEGERFGIVLSNQDCQCGAAYNETKPYRVELSYNRFRQATKEEDFVVFAHESTHVQTPIRGYIPVYSEADRQTIQVEESPWYDELNRILGGRDYLRTRALLGERYRAASVGLHAKLPVRTGGIQTKEEWEDMLQKTYTQEECEQFEFYGRLNDILWYPYRTLPEFVAFLAENYVKGKPYFDRNFERLLQPDEFAGVYDLTKQSIFRGKEYSKHPLT